MHTLNLKKINEKLDQFVSERDWEKFHSIKNLSMALSVEASELAEIFQWLNEEESNQSGQNPELRRKLQEEIADVFIYLCRIAKKTEINLEEAVFSKIEINEKKYPVEKSKGSSRKYNEL